MRATINAVLAVMALETAALMPAGAQQSEGAPGGLLSRVVNTNAKAVAGVLANDRTIDVDIGAGPMRRSEHNTAAIVNKDGEATFIHYTQVVQNGERATSAAIAERERRENQDLQSGKTVFRRPYDARYTAEYEYTAARCVPCEAGAVAIAFRSRIRDEAHGDGLIKADAATARLEAVTYEPNRLPAHATAATIVETFGEALPSMWTVVRIDRRYCGRVGFFSGHATVTEILSHYRRYNTLAAALTSTESAMP